MIIKMNRKIVSLLCVFSLLPMGAVYAAPIDSIKENVDTGGIIVSGDFGEKDRIAVELIKPGVGTESLNGANNANIMSLIENVLHFKTSDGKYEVEIPVSEDAVAGVYTVAVNGDRLNTVARATIEWKSPEVIKGVFDNFIKTVSQDEVYALISQKDNCDCLGISYSLMNNLSDSEKKDIARELFNNKASIQKVADLRSVYTDKAVILAIPKAVDNDELIKIILEYPDVLNISEKDNFKDFKNKGNTYQKSIASRILRKNISLENLVKN